MFQRVKAILRFADACKVSEAQLSEMLGAYLGEA